MLEKHGQGMITLDGSLVDIRQHEKGLKVTVKLSEEDAKELKKGLRVYFKDTPERFRPSWIDTNKPWATFGCRYTVPVVVGEEDMTFDNVHELIAAYGSLKGSKIVVSVLVKPGQMFLKTVLIEQVEGHTLADFFEDGYKYTE